MGGPVSEDATGEPTSGPALEVIVLAAEDLKNVNMVGKMSVYVVAWVEPHFKRSTCVQHKTSRNAAWNDALLIPITDAILRHPHSTLTVQVYSTRTVRPTIVGTTYLRLGEIARMKATKPNWEEGDIVALPLHRPSGRTQGSIRISVNLTGATIQQMMYALDNGHDGWAIEMPTAISAIQDGLVDTGYAAVPPCSSTTSSYPSSSDDDVNAAFLPSAPPLALAAPPAPCLMPNTATRENQPPTPPPAPCLMPNTATRENQPPTPPAPCLMPNTASQDIQPSTPPPARPPSPVPSGFSNHSNFDPHPCAQARNEYIPVQVRRQRGDRENFVLALISGVGGLVGGLVLGDIISAAL